MRFWQCILVSVFLLATLPGCAAVLAHSSRAQASVHFRVQIRAGVGVSDRLARRIKARLQILHQKIGHDFSVYPRGLRVEIFGTHRGFAFALKTEQHEQAQSDLDDSSNIVHNTLLLGPLPRSYLWHNLTHVYTEWIIDHLIHNTNDTLPSDPWLYDGLAEYEAYRYAPAGFVCSGSGNDSILNVTNVRTGKEWMAIRAGPMSQMEYCLAYLHVRAIVRHAGWGCVTGALRSRGGWPVASAMLSEMDRTHRCA